MKTKFYILVCLASALCFSDFVAYSALPGGLGTLRILPPVTIKGKVVADDGMPMIGVSIMLKGTTIVTRTDANGNYQLNLADATGTLVYTFIGYHRLELPVNSKAVGLVTLKAIANNLDEVVVVGYNSTQTRRDVTGSIATMKGVEIEKYNVTSFQTALQGRLPGVEISESSGAPGAALNVRIRGLTSINGSSAPLYIIDGNPVITGTDGDGDDPITNGDNTGTKTNILSDINPNDIESIEVLKDAAATAIYGARGGAGVILITTKRGKAGKTSYNVSMITGFNQISKQVSILNGPQLLGILDEAWRNQFYSVPSNIGLPVPATPMPALTGFTRGMADTTNIDHFKEVIQTGSFREVNLSATNGTEKTKYYINGNYRQTIPNTKGVDMNQYSLRVNIDHILSKFITVGVSLSPAYSVTNRLGSGDVTALGGYGGALVTNLPIYPNYNADGTYFNPWTNPIAFQNRDLYKNSENRVRMPVSAYLEAKITPNLSLRTMVQREDFNQEGLVYTSGLLRLRSADNTNSVTSPFANDQLAKQNYSNSYGYSNSWQSFFTYKKNFNKVHDLEGTAGMNFSEANTFFTRLVGENYASTNFIYPSQGATIEAGSVQTIVDDNLAANLSYFARAFYKYKRRYLLSLVVNREGSSRFGGNKRFGTFPAASVGWIASDEKFLRRSKVVSFLKFRASGGLTGSSAGISNKANFSVWQVSPNTSGYMATGQLQVTAPANLNLHWEKGIKFDVGVDASFIKGRIATNLDLYLNKTTEMLLEIPAPYTFGYGGNSQAVSFLENRGALRNKGIEFSINTNNLTGKFKWRTNFNISRNITTILDLGGLRPDAVSGGVGSVQLYVGKQGPVYNLIEFAGVDPQTGGELIHDKDGNTVLASTLTKDQLDAARKPQYDKLAAPKFFGGINNTFQYKAFDLSVFFSYKYGNYLVDQGERIASYVGNIRATSYANNVTNAAQGAAESTITVGNLYPAILNRWTYPGQETDVPKVYWNDVAIGTGTNPNVILRDRNTTRFLHDASYIRLKNIQLGYTLPTRVAARLGLKSARVNVTGQNLWMYTKFPGADPEAITVTAANYRERNIAYGIIQNAIPLSKSVTFGINVGF